MSENLCNGCDLCCRKYKIYLFPNEAKAISRKLKINYKDFVSKYLDYYFELFPYQPNLETNYYDIVLDKKRYYLFACLALKQKYSGCVFLKNRQCTIYTSRPLICRLFPEFKFYDEKFDFCELDKKSHNIENPRQFYPEMTKYLQAIKHNGFENTWKYLPVWKEDNVYVVIDGKKQKLSEDLLNSIRTVL